MVHTRFKASMAFCLVLLVSMVQPYLLFSSDEMPSSHVVNAAERGVKVFVKDSRAQDLHRFGFSSRTQIDGAALGMGFQVFYIPPDRLLNQELPEDMAAYALPTNMWQFLIMSDGSATCLLTVDFANNRWAPVSMGASGLSGELGRIPDAWPLSAGYRHRLIRVYQAKADFIEILQNDITVGIVPFTSGRIAMSLNDRAFNPLDLFAPDEVLAKLRSVVKVK